jgi:hypothetical protein
MIVKELKGWPHVFTLTSGKTFRIFANEEKSIPAEEVSEDMRRAVKMKLVSIVEEMPKAASAVGNYSKSAARKSKKK